MNEQGASRFPNSGTLYGNIKRSRGWCLHHTPCSTLTGGEGYRCQSWSPSKDSVPVGNQTDELSQSQVTPGANPNPTAPSGHGGGKGAQSRPRTMVPGNSGYIPSGVQNVRGASR